MPLPAVSTAAGTALTPLPHSAVAEDFDNLPRGARAEDYDRKGIDDTLAMLADPEGCALVDLFGAAIQEDGSTWLNDRGHYVAALFGITATSPTRRRLHDVWQATARTVVAAQDAAA